MADQGTHQDVEALPAAADQHPPGALITDAVLCAEALAIHGAEIGATGPALYDALHRLGSNALCLSGGGIRSASFALGVIQALAVHPRPSPTTAVDTANNSFLAKFHYLSTVSGGGYIGGWLTACMTRVGLPAVWAGLVGRPDGPDVEPPVISWLRAYSNFLTPKLGVMSADSWAAFALLLRNLFLNWLVILPVLCAGLLALKLYAFAVAWFSQFDPNSDSCGTSMSVAVYAAAAGLLAALWFTHRQRPTRGASTAGQIDFLRGSLAPSMLAGMFFSFALASPCAHDALVGVPWFADLSSLGARGLACGVAIYLLGWALALPFWDVWQPARQALRERRGVRAAIAQMSDWHTWRNVRRDFVAVLGAGAIFGVLMALGVHVYLSFWDGGIAYFGRAETLLVLFAVPWTLGCQLIAEIIFVGLSSYEKNSDADREWLGRAAGWYLVAAIGWALVMFLVFLGSILAADLYRRITVWLSGIGMGGVAAWLAKSRATPAKDAKDRTGLSINMVASLAAIVFAVFLVVMTSALLDRILIGAPLVMSDQFGATVTQAAYPAWPAGWRLPAGLGLLLLIAWGASYFVNINRFSLHALYRNRLIRAFLGASHAQGRRPNPFTDFDTKDNLAMSELWPPEDMWSQLRGTYVQPFHVVNMALNIVSTKRKAWQERKAESFTMSPLHCGSACGGLASLPNGALRAYGAYRPSASYGGEEGISLGTAVAISGAAASPNMGYNSSPPLAFLMTMFNVRLGWWLGNPEKDKLIHRSEGPRLAIQPLFAEMFGLTNDESDYVYLSDGGHFENLALYEMVRRRCRLIVVSDAGCDPDFAFEDLGNAVRKIALDLGVTITFHGVSTLRTRVEEERQAQCCGGDNTADEPPGTDDIALFAIGTIDYGPGQDGVVLYLKAAYHRAAVKNVGVRSYAIANPDFPHQSTADQFFSESQFESYRALGFELMDDVLRRGTALSANPANPTLEGILEALRDQAVNAGAP